MGSEHALIDKLTTLNRIGDTLNRAVDVQGVLDDALADLMGLMGLETGWVFIADPAAEERRYGSGYRLAAHHNLPAALDPESSDAWEGNCICQRLVADPSQAAATNEVHCARLQQIDGGSTGLTVHATVPLRSGQHSLGILNVAAPDWSSFSPEALSLLTTVGSQMGTALERARLFDLLRQRRGDEQEALLRLSQQVLNRLDSDQLMDFMVEQVRIGLRADACALILPGEMAGTLAFRAASGWRDCPAAKGRQVPADPRSGPGWVMQNQLPLQAEDLWENDTTRFSPDWLQAEGFRGHAVVPLLVEGRSVGVLVLNQRERRLLDQDDLRLLQLMANQAALAIEKVRLHREEVKAQAWERELAVGREIQLGLLPRGVPALPGWELHTYYQAAREVGGDFYDFLELPDHPGTLGLIVGDVTGKGVPAALFMARTTALICSTASDGLRPAATLNRVNDLLVQNRRFDLFLTVLYARLDPDTGELVLANAGHCRPMWLHAGSGAVEEVRTRGIILGAFESIELEEDTIHLLPGDVLVLYTDGVTEAMNGDHELFGEARLLTAVKSCAGASAGEVVEAVVRTVEQHTGAEPQSDDVALLVLRRCPES